MKFSKLQVASLVISLVALASYFTYRKESYGYLFAATFFIVFSWVELLLFIRVKEENLRYNISFVKFWCLLLTGMLIVWNKKWDIMSLSGVLFLLYFVTRFVESFILKTKRSQDVSNTPDKS